MSRRDFQILYVDASPQAIASDLPNRSTPRLLHVSSNEEALACLRSEGRYHGKRRPDLILLNLPSHDCPGFLTLLKADDRLRRIPVVVMGPNSDRADILHAYDCYANCYVTRPETVEKFERVLHSLEEFWFNVAKLPAA